MSESKDGGFFMSKRDVGDAKDRTASRDDFDSKGSKQSDLEVDEEDVLAEDARPPRRASVGWGSAEGNSAAEDKQAEGAPSLAPAAETKRTSRRRKGGDGATSGSDGKANRNRHFDDDRDSAEIVEIPDLEEEEREPDIITQVAEAPRNTTRNVQSLKELDRDIKFALPSSAVIESDEVWNFDSLLNEVSQEMQKDLDEKEDLMKAEGA